MFRLLAALAALATLAGTAPADGPSFQGVTYWTSEYSYSNVGGVSRDGSVAVGGTKVATDKNPNGYTDESCTPCMA